MSSWIGFALGVAAALGCHQATPGAAVRPAPTDTTRVSVTAVRNRQVPEGHMVIVDGSCLGTSSTRAPGAPPRTRSDWILADDSTAVYVVGALPIGCAPLGGQPVPATIVARVALDTVGSNVRAFLIRIPN